MKRILPMCLAALGLSVAAPAFAAEYLGTAMNFCVNPTTDEITQLDNCTGGGQTVKLRYKRDEVKSFSASTTVLNQVTKAIIVVHGIGRVPTGVFQPVYDDTKVIDGMEPTVWVIAPQFLYNTDFTGATDNFKWPANEEDGYMTGGLSNVPSGVAISSFAVMDAVIRKMKMKAPNITEFIIGGHSGGGQFVLRYSMATQIENHSELSGVKFRYIISAPGTYTYLNTDRYNADEIDWNVPAVTPSCPGYNTYRYGLDGIPVGHYMSTPFTVQQLRDRFNDKRRLFLVGSADTAEEETDCRINVQGLSRVSRAFNYMQHLRKQGKGPSASFCVVNGIDHDGDVLGSGAAVMFWMYNNVDCSYDDNIPAN